MVAKCCKVKWHNAFFSKFSPNGTLILYFKFNFKIDCEIFHKFACPALGRSLPSFATCFTVFGDERVH